MSSCSSQCSEKCRTATAYVVGVIGSFLIIGTLAWLVVRSDATPVDAQRAADNEAFLKSLARLESIRVLADGEVAPLSVKKLIGATELMIPMAGLIDKEAELARLAKEVARLVGECGRIEGKLGNEAFVAKAPPAVIEQEKKRVADFGATLSRIEEQLARLG